MNINRNIELIFDKIAKACQRSGRSPEKIRLIGVTKTADIEQIKQALGAGITEIGENRVHLAQKKYQCLRLAGFNFKAHMIGHLQSNKAKEALELFDLVQSVDSVHLAQKLQHYCRIKNKFQDILLEVNTSGEVSKFGFGPAEIKESFLKMTELENLKIKGLMTMAPFKAQEKRLRECFSLLRRLSDDLCFKEDPVLSMGMSDDFEIAIEEGANMIRLGRSIFGE